jgi:predicted transcriptional regulator
MINLKQIEDDIKELPQEAQSLLVDFIDLLKKCYGNPENQKPNDSKSNTLEILQKSGLIGCISAENNLSKNYKTVLTEGLNQKYDDH